MKSRTKKCDKYKKTIADSEGVKVFTVLAPWKKRELVVRVKGGTLPRHKKRKKRYSSHSKRGKVQTRFDQISTIETTIGITGNRHNRQ